MKHGRIFSLTRPATLPAEVSSTHMKRRTWGLALLFLLLISVARVSATERRTIESTRGAEAPSTSPNEGADDGLVRFTATVTDREGRYVAGLGSEDFRIYEDGRAQRLALFTTEDVPVSVGIVFDTSGSMLHKLEDVQDAVEHFLATLNPKDDVFLLRFSSHVSLAEPFTDNRHLLSKALRRLRARGSTILYDAVVEAAQYIQEGRHRKKALLVITDGNDTGSSATFEQALDAVQRAEVLVYTLGIGHNKTTSSRRTRHGTGKVDLEVLEALAEVSGGGSYHLVDAHAGKVDLIDLACREVSGELRRQYVLGYYPDPRAEDGSFRRIQVETRFPRYTVRTQRGYFATRSRTATASPSTSTSPSHLLGRPRVLEEDISDQDARRSPRAKPRPKSSPRDSFQP